MFSAVALPAHLAVIVLLAVLALRMFAAAEEKGRSGLRWMLLFFGLWISTLGLATRYRERVSQRRPLDRPRGERRDGRKPRGQ